MNFLRNCAFEDLSRNVAAMWMLIVYTLSLICTGTSISITSSTCGEKYDMNVHKKMVVTHNGTNILYENPCTVEFTKTSNEQYLCIYGDDIKLDCDTSLEYHQFFVKTYLPPEVKMSCNTSSIINGEWCPSQYQDYVFIVIRKFSESTSDDIKLRVYLKDVPEDDSNNLGGVSSTTLMIIIIPIVVVVVFSCTYAFIKLKCRNASTSRPQVAYQTTSGTAADLPAGQAQTGQYPASAFSGTNPQAYPVQQSGLQGNYNVYPMQTAYPVQKGAEPGNQNYGNAH